jgi:ATP-dependent RNA helicase RhlE
MADPALSRVIVFTRTKHGANRLAGQLLKDGVNADAIHGNKSQGARQRALENFREGTARVLVATDIAARGIDVDGVTHVINFDLPMEAESYIHRIGRTARAGASGLAISFCDPAERKYLRDIERLIKRPITPANSVEEAGEEPRGSSRPKYRGPKQGRPNGGGEGQPARRKFRRSRNRRKVA